MKNKGIFVTAVSTGAGKTVISSVLCRKLIEKGVKTAYFKPVQTGGIKEKKVLISPDCKFVKKTAGDKIRIHCSYIFTKPASPHFASNLEKKKILPETIINDFNSLNKEGYFIIAEGAGGLYVPVNAKGYTMLDLAKDLKLDLLLVAPSGLGSINHTMLSFFYAKKNSVKISNIILLYCGKKPDDIDRNNYDIIKKMTAVKNVYLLPAVSNIDTDACITGDLIKKTKLWDIDLGEITG